MTPVSIVASPAAKVMLPSQSMRVRWRSPISRSHQNAHTMAIRPMGTFMAKTSRQWTVASTPPKIRPIKEPASSETPLMPRAKPRWLCGNASVMMAAELAITMAPPIACTMRRMMISRAPTEPVLHTSERPPAAAVKTIKPILKTRTRPYMSPTRPAVTTSEAETSP